MIQITESDEIILESLIRSPAFATLKKVLLDYRDQCMSELMSCVEPNRLFQIQGRMIGIQVVENLPGVIVDRRNKRLKTEAEKAKREEEINKRLGKS